jgi:predicted AAA+ superfamily ATPase
LELTKKQQISADKTLIFFDEIQACERALTSLKYFCEQAPEYYVAGAGSLLGVAVNREKYSFPVGKVDEHYMFPLDFEEFLWALGYEKLAEEIKIHFESNKPMNTALHKLALELYKKYLVVGGMPAVVKRFVETNSFLSAQVVQNDIFNEYTADMSKYAGTTASVKIRACYNSIPAQLAKENRKFQYKIVQKGGTATIFGESLEWLNFAGTILKCQKITEGNIPIAVYAYFPDFKLYMSDVGLLALKSRLPAELLVAENNEENTFMGSVTENYVAQAFTANRIPLFYWKNDNTAEVDFVLQKGVDVIPVEVKRGVNTRSKSMNIFAKQYKCPYSIRISQKNFGFENDIKSVPLYAVFCITD